MSLGLFYALPWISPNNCSLLLPRLAAIACGEAISLSPLRVAHTTFTGLVEPKHFPVILWMPATSNTARIAPPAIIPVPVGAGRIVTFEAPWFVVMGW